jgi:hypothetical protein
MSAVQDSIGSQASKGMHVIARFAPRIVECGVWSGGKGRLTAIETYPTPCRGSALVLERLDGHLYGDSDRDDAEVCAIIASIFATDRGRLQCPGPEVPEREGWIWILR